MKFGLRFKITIQTKVGEAIIVEPPLTVRLTVNRHLNASVNGMVLEIYNLSPQNRNLIYQDRFDVSRFKIIVEAGYDNLSTIFIGDIYEANSTREGTDIITSINARDGNYDVNQTVVSTTLAAGSTLKEVLEFLTAQFPNLKFGKITQSNPNLEAQLERPVVLEGNVYGLLKQYASAAGASPFIDLEVINILGVDEVLVNDSITVINATTGLINTPRRDQAFLTVTTLFEPKIVIGQIIALESEILPQYNGLYKVVGVQHHGIISEAVTSRCTSVFNLVGNQIIGGFTAL